MSDLGPEISADVAKACQQNAGEIAEALTRSLDQPMTASSGEPATWQADKVSGAGLIVLLEVGPTAAALCIPGSSGLLPDWYTQPDATGKSKLATLAQELGMLLFPDSIMASGGSAFAVDDLAQALQQGQLADEPGNVALSIEAGGHTQDLQFVWPLAAPTGIQPAKPTAVPNLSAERLVPEERRAPPAPLVQDPYDSLPPYSRSLLHIQVPVMVTLAAKKQPVSKIVELVPGSILQFNKSCDELLDLEVSGLPVAKGECIKVGDKFGLRVSSLVLPAERFKSVG